VAGWGGKLREPGVEACHFIHGDLDIDAFVFAPRGEGVSTSMRAVADAAKFEIRIPDSDLRLSFRKFGEKVVDYVTLRPVEGTIRLVIWNQPKMPHTEGGTRRPHFEAYYELATAKTLHLSVPSAPQATAGKERGSCEDLLAEIDPRKKPKDTFPHNIRECDSMLYGATSLPEWK